MIATKTNGEISKLFILTKRFEDKGIGLRFDSSETKDKAKRYKYVPVQFKHEWLRF